MKSFLKKSWPFIFLAVLSFIIHFAFLSYPAQVVFDEVHFGKFVAAYSTGQYYFDIHPPLGKLMIAGFVRLTGLNPVFDFEKIGENLPANILLTLRFLPAFFGALFVLFFSWLAYLLSRSRQTALIAGFLILLDNAFLVQSKFILVDIFMLCFEVLTLSFFFLWQQQTKFNAKWFGYLALTGAFAGLTISVKWTGLAVIGIMGVVLLVKVFSKKLALYLSSSVSHPEHIRSAQYKLREESIKDSSAKLSLAHAYGLRMTKFALFKESLLGFFVVLLIAFIIYLLPFYLHFKLLPNSGPGDAFMSQSFQQELKYGRDNVFQPLNFWQKFTELNKTMYTANANLTAEHPFGSKWYAWPLNSKPVYYWNQDTLDALPGWQARIYFSGNPVLWWLAGLSLIFVLLSSTTKNSRRRLSPIFYILLLGYFANLLPFIFVNRVAFLYHYLPTAMYAILILSLLLINFRSKSKTFFWITIALIIFGFIITAPLSYGWLLPPQFSQLATQFIILFN
ncbi:phospholipid carrier-dependent glycosyltransferase [Patescibacteria group bacterium]|nr:phospholipid carrier-dependent glycosyltransferase [Patescibacteria group bacterium]MBU2219561.1 phospholipid carrier-dependent glycosyltransferase [Patescibacteria group bacterium]MBU2265042.1 phospholipid carrier-dependent glycosyltransferase [Patescibacteria group bacterium]